RRYAKIRPPRLMKTRGAAWSMLWIGGGTRNSLIYFSRAAIGIRRIQSFANASSKRLAQPLMFRTELRALQSRGSDLSAVTAVRESRRVCPRKFVSRIANWRCRESGGAKPRVAD